MRILVAGAQGQLARSLQGSRHPNGHVVVVRGRPGLDVLNPASLDRAIADIAPDLVVNAAAYTAVDKAESDRSEAFAVNRDGAGALAKAAAAHGCPVIHVSTDYVFDGAKKSAYEENDHTAPTGAYGQSKLEGEQEVARANPRHLIVRTAWIYSPYGNNFLRTMLRLASERPELRVVADQHGNPTFAPHLADALLTIAGKIEAGLPNPWGIYHAAGTGAATWHAFATAIVAAASPLGINPVPVVPIATADFPTPTRRPANSCLDCSKLARVFDVRLPHWQQGVRECIEALANAAPRA